MEGRRVGEGGDMTGKSPTGEEHYFFGRKNYWRGEDCMLGLLFFLVLGVWFWGVFLIIAGGTGLLGVLGTWARISFGFLELGSRTGCS